MITGQITTIPERFDCLRQTIKSVLMQVTRLNVILSTHTTEQVQQLYREWMPEMIQGRIFFDKPEDGTKTDGDKYYKIEDAAPGYIFLFDDDLVYAPGYVDYMVKKIDQYNREAVVSLHGRCFNELPIYSFYRDRPETNPFDGTRMPHDGDKPVIYRCLADVAGDHRVHCVGDGVAAWHTDGLKMRYEYIKGSDMSQLWLALYCNRMGIKQYVVEHREGMVEAIWDGPGIWDRQQDDSVQTALVNNHWMTQENYWKMKQAEF